MSQIDVVQLVADAYPHLRAFDEVAASLAEAVRDAGHSGGLLRGTTTGPGRNIILGGHLLADADLEALPADTIFYNFEQVTDSSLMPPARLPRFARFEIWEYAQKNLPRWADAGVEAHHVDVGWSPNLEVLDTSGPKPVDVLFYGSLNDRRRRILDGLRQAGLKVDARFGVYGAQRDALICRSKVVLNVQFYSTRILEMVRLSYLLANGIAVASEWAPDLEIPDGFEDAAAFAPYDELVDATVELVRDDAARAELGRVGQQRMRARPWRLPGMGDPVGSVRGLTTRTADAGSAQPGAPTRRQLVLVTGAHRTGVAAVGAALRAGGAEIDPTTDVEVQLLLDRILALTGTRWDGFAPPPPEEVRDHDQVRLAVDDLRHLLAGLDGDRVVLADPRIAMLLPLWQDLAADADDDLHVVLTLRDPAAAARSLSAAHGFDQIKSMLLWLSGTIFTEAGTRGRSRSIVAYEDLRAHPVEVLTRVLGDLGDVDPAAGAAAGAETVDTQRDHHAAAVEPDVPQVRAAAMARQVDAALRAGDLAVVDRLAASYLEGIELFEPLITRLRGARDQGLDRFV